MTSKGARPDFLEDLAALTGGRLHEVDARSDLSASFRSILDEFRYRYLVTYTPRGVPAGRLAQIGGPRESPRRVGKSQTRLSGPVTRLAVSIDPVRPQHE